MNFKAIFYVKNKAERVKLLIFSEAELVWNLLEERERLEVIGSKLDVTLGAN